jgi:VWFA-related protein
MKTSLCGGLTWRTHSCVPRRNSSRRALRHGHRASAGVPTRHAGVRAPRRQPRGYHLSALLLFLCLPLAAQTGGLGDQGTSNLKLKAEARLVLVDEVVTGKKDEPVLGLEAKDFHVFEDGKEQAITAFQTRTGPATPGISRQQHFVLLIDAQYDQLLGPDDLKWIQQGAAKFIADNAGPNRLMSVVYYAWGCLTIATQFTSDVGELQHSLGAWPGLSSASAGPPSILYASPFAGQPPPTPGERFGSSSCPGSPDPDGYVRYRFYKQLATDLGHVPGHKVVALFAAGVPEPVTDAATQQAPGPPSIRRQASQLERNADMRRDPFGMVTEFRKANVSVYPAGATASAQNPPWALRLADVTGGHELFRGNDVVAVFDAIAHEQDESYTLGYVPQESPEGSCHELKVTVDRPDVKVRGRNLYCNVKEITLASTNPLEAELENLAASPHAGNTAAAASLPFFYETGGVARVDLALEIPASVLNPNVDMAHEALTPVLVPTEANGRLHASMDVLGLAYNLGGGVAARFGDKVSFHFANCQQFDSFIQHPLRYEHQFEIAPGNYRFKLIFRTTKDRFGVVETPLAVDPVDAAQLSVSAIALSHNVQPVSQDDAQEELDEGKKPLIFRGNQITVAGSDILPKAGIAEAYFEIYQPPAAGAGPVQLTMRLRLVDAQSNLPKWDSGDVDLSALAKSGGRAIPVALKLPVASLPAGTYRAELVVKDSTGGETARSVQFRTE